MNINRLNEETRQNMIRVAKQLFDEGLTVREAAAKMCVSEATVRSLRKAMDDAKSIDES